MQPYYEKTLQLIEDEASAGDILDFKLAREEFHKFTGQFDESEPWYEIRMTMFMDWYLLDRKGTDGLTPAARYLNKYCQTLDREKIEQINNFMVTLRSMFQIMKIDGTTLLLNDLISGGRWLTYWTIPLAGLKEGRIVNTRIIRSGNTLFAGRGTVLHPQEAHDSIFDIIDRAEQEQMPALHVSSYMDKINLKLNRYSNVKIKHVYKYPADAIF